MRVKKRGTRMELHDQKQSICIYSFLFIQHLLYLSFCIGQINFTIMLLPCKILSLVSTFLMLGTLKFIFTYRRPRLAEHECPNHS